MDVEYPSYEFTGLSFHLLLTVYSYFPLQASGAEMQHPSAMGSSQGALSPAHKGNAGDVHSSSGSLPVSLPLAFLACSSVTRRVMEVQTQGCVLPPAGGLVLHLLTPQAPYSPPASLPDALTAADTARRPSLYYTKEGNFFFNSQHSRWSEDGAVYVIFSRYVPPSHNDDGKETKSSENGDTTPSVTSPSKVVPTNRWGPPIPPPPRPKAASVPRDTDTEAGVSPALEAMQHALWWIRKALPIKVSVSLLQYPPDQVETITNLLSVLEKDNESCGTEAVVAEIALRGSAEAESLKGIFQSSKGVKSVSIMNNSAIDSAELRQLSKNWEDVVKLTLSMNPNITSTHFLCPSPSSVATSRTQPPPARGRLSYPPSAAASCYELTDLVHSADQEDVPYVYHYKSPHLEQSSRFSVSEGALDSLANSQRQEVIPPPSERRQPAYVMRSTEVEMGEAQVTPRHRDCMTSIAPDAPRQTAAAEQQQKEERKPITHWSHALQDLDLSFTMVEDTDVARDLPQLKQLAVLSLEGCHGITQLSWAPQMNLFELNLSRTALSVSAFATLRLCARLEVLRLGFCTALQDLQWILEAPPLLVVEVVPPAGEGNGPTNGATAATRVHVVGATAVRTEEHGIPAYVVQQPRVTAAEQTLMSANNALRLHTGVPLRERMDVEGNLFPLQRSLRCLYVNNTPLTDRGLQAVTLFPNLELLSLRHCDHVTDVNVLAELPLLTELDLSETNVTREGLERLRECFVLRRLLLLRCPRLRELPSQLPRLLDTLNCMGCLHLSSQAALSPAEERQVEKTNPLRYLFLRSCESLARFPSLARATQLVELDLHHTLVDSATLVAGLQHCTSIEVLHLGSSKVTDLSAWCGERTDEEEGDAPRERPLFLQTLRYLDLSKTMVNAKSCTFLMYCPRLVVLLLTRCSAVEDLSFLPLREEEEEEGKGGVRPNLLYLSITDSALLTDDALRYLLYCPELQYLSLARCGGISKIAHFITECKKLTELDLSATNITHEALSVLFDREIPLRTLRLRSNPQLLTETEEESERAVGYFTKISSLQALHLSRTHIRSK
ncbi:hypothetical protein ADEAN_000758800 [Angomonas deanei]|uniref:Leucine Rich repeat n=1 Tax=Angomonas deanei TaxID=59799 RepID=A0A7G2CMB9_9TRYP|nr:hypothetical protein ADEAN_000758800 [Angomonas deanei]